MEVSLREEVVRFRKNNSREAGFTYEIPFRKVAGDELCACVLMYYPGSSAELLE